MCLACPPAALLQVRATVSSTFALELQAEPAEAQAWLAQLRQRTASLSQHHKNQHQGRQDRQEQEYAARLAQVAGGAAACCHAAAWCRSRAPLLLCVPLLLSRSSSSSRCRSRAPLLLCVPLLLCLASGAPPASRSALKDSHAGATTGQAGAAAQRHYPHWRPAQVREAFSWSCLSRWACS